MGGTTWRVETADAGCRLVKFLADADRLASRGRAEAAIGRGQVLVNDQEVTDPGRRLAGGDRVRAWIDRPGTARRRVVARRGTSTLRIVHEDDAVVVVNKPPGVLAVRLPGRQRAPSVEDQLIGHLRSRGKRRPLVVHRIDRDTSGLVVFALRPEAQEQLRAQFRRHEPERVYLALVSGHPSPPAGRWRDRLAWDSEGLVQRWTHPGDPSGRDASCDYRVVESFAGACLVEIRLITGRRNQIRLQAGLRGHPLIGERQYLGGPSESARRGLGRQALHAHRLGFRHPVSGRPVRFEAPLPEDMANLVVRLRLRPPPGAGGVPE